MLFHLLVEWKPCSSDICKAQDANSHCLEDPRTSKVTCKCNEGYFGRANEPRCMSKGNSLHTSQVAHYAGAYLWYEFMIDHRSYTYNLSSCEIKVRPERDSNP